MFGRGQGKRDLGRVEERLVWLLGSPRTGSTWLLHILARHERVVAADEPNVGMHLAPFMQDVFAAPAESFPQDLLLVNRARAESPHYFFSDQHEAAWRPALRRLLLARFQSQLGGRRDALCVIKEPNGSQAADVILSTLPRSKVVFLLRDGRDVLDSQLDAARRGSWLARSFGGGQEMDPAERLEFLRAWAHKWVVRMEVVQAAYAAHDPDRRLLMRYEDLRADTLPQVRRLVDWLGLEIHAAELERIVAEFAFEQIPSDRRGPGQFARAATPGLWRDSFSDEERAAVEQIAGPKLAELGYDAPASPVGAGA